LLFIEVAGGPDGGNGGPGGDVYLATDEHCADLSFQSYHFAGARGAHGTSALCHGRKGDDLVIKIPRMSVAYIFLLCLYLFFSGYHSSAVAARVIKYNADDFK
jgi:GTPase involved in cell partitioning and DNA repair